MVKPCGRMSLSLIGEFVFKIMIPCLCSFFYGWWSFLEEMNGGGLVEAFVGEDIQLVLLAFYRWYHVFALPCPLCVLEGKIPLFNEIKIFKFFEFILSLRKSKSSSVLWLLLIGCYYTKLDMLAYLVMCGVSSLPLTYLGCLLWIWFQIYNFLEFI